MKKRLKLKWWVKWLLVSLALLGIIVLIDRIDRGFVDSCKSAGYSEAYCIAHK